MFYVNYFPKEQPLVEETPNGDASVELKLDARATKTMEAIMALSSLELSHLLGAVFNLGVIHGERAARGAVRRAASAPPSPPA